LKNGEDMHGTSEKTWQKFSCKVTVVDYTNSLS